MAKSMDLQAVEIARQIRRLNEKAMELAAALHDHPNGEGMVNWLMENGCLTQASAETCIHAYLEHPERWEAIGGIGLGRKRKQVEPSE